MIDYKRRGLGIGLVLLVAIALADAIWALFAVHLNSALAGCLFEDGRSYCRLASGQMAAAPFNRRILAPMVVRLMHVGSLATRFGVLDLVGMTSAVLATILLGRLLARNVGQSDRVALTVGIAGAAMFTLSPYAVRDIRYAPTLVDDPALGLGLFALLAILTAKSWTAVAVAAALTLAAMLTRESWGLPLAAAAIISARPWTRRGPRRKLVYAVIAVIGFGAAVQWTLPYSGPSVSPFTVALQRIDYYGSIHGAADLIYQVTMATGGFLALIGCLLLIPSVRRPLLSPVGLPLTVAALSLTCEGVVGGTDIGRIAYSGLPVIAILALAGLVACDEVVVVRFGVVTLIATVVFFHPWMTLSGSGTNYGLHLYFNGGLQTTQTMVFGLLVAAGIGIGAWQWHIGARARRLMSLQYGGGWSSRNHRRSMIAARVRRSQCTTVSQGHSNGYQWWRVLPLIDDPKRPRNLQTVSFREHDVKNDQVGWPLLCSSDLGPPHFQSLIPSAMDRDSTSAGSSPTTRRRWLRPDAADSIGNSINHRILRVGKTRQSEKIPAEGASSQITTEPASSCAGRGGHHFLQVRRGYELTALHSCM